MDPKEDHLPPLAPSEWLLMSCVWELGLANALEVSEMLRTSREGGLSPKTTGILLARIAEKGYLSITAVPRIGGGRPIYSYTPVVSRETALRRQIDRFFEVFRLDDADLDLMSSIIEERRGAKV